MKLNIIIAGVVVCILGWIVFVSLYFPSVNKKIFHDQKLSLINNFSDQIPLSIKDHKYVHEILTGTELENYPQTISIFNLKYNIAFWTIENGKKVAGHNFTLNNSTNPPTIEIGIYLQPESITDKKNILSYTNLHYILALIELKESLNTSPNYQNKYIQAEKLINDNFAKLPITFSK